MSTLKHVHLPVPLPLPLVWPITSQLLGVGEETTISRTSLMHSHCMMNIKKPQTSTSVVGAAGRGLSRKGGWMFFSLMQHREKGNEQEYVLFSSKLLRTTGHAAQKVVSSSLQFYIPRLSHCVLPWDINFSFLEKLKLIFFFFKKQEYTSLGKKLFRGRSSQTLKTLQFKITTTF